MPVAVSETGEWGRPPRRPARPSDCQCRLLRSLLISLQQRFASSALGNGIPITDVAEWMGHTSIEETYCAYRHLMPGSITKAVRILDAALWEAA